MFLAAHTNDSAWSGVSFFDISDFTLTKTIHSLTPSTPPTKLEVYDELVRRSGDSFSEEFFMHDRLACYHTTGRCDVDVTLDIRAPDDYDEHGREHRATVIQTNPTIIHFENAKGSCVLLTTADVSLVNEWVEQATAYDDKRSGRGTWWVQRRAVIHADEQTRTVLAPANRLEEAKQLLAATHVFEKRLPEVASASSLARSSLDGLVTKTPNGEASILAGIPWFFQIYTRDEAIAAGALLVEKDFDLAGRILLREITTVLPDGLIPNRFPHSQVGSADGVGWAFLRLRELFLASPDCLRDEQWRFVLRQLSRSLRRLREHRVRDGLVVNQPQETWMDTTGGTADTRAGARIEIQALTLNMLRFHQQLAGFLSEDSSVFTEFKDLLHGRVREEFFDGSLLADGSGDARVRPNIFIAYYAYEELLSNDEWARVFRTAVSKLFLDWGAFASIDSSDELFLDEHTGENDASYHRGDAWYFLSNLAAVCLLRVSDEFLPVARRVFAASEQDLLFGGACGHCSEISSASRREAFGCWSQAWSASTFIELASLLER